MEAALVGALSCLNKISQKLKKLTEGAQAC
jgi:hypothetical protein